MGMLGDMKNKAKGLVTGNREKIDSGLEKAGDAVNQKTGGKHEDKIDKGLGKVQEGLDKVAGTEGGASTAADTPPPPPGPLHEAPPPTNPAPDANPR